MVIFLKNKMNFLNRKLRRFWQFSKFGYLILKYMCPIEIRNLVIFFLTMKYKK